jgi:peptidoglycan/xylan/chitin deacetylase (PgdA/CDA1 family)
MMDVLPVVIILNYHRIGPTDPANPLHRLHAVDPDIFRAQLGYMQSCGRLVGLEDIRLNRGLGPLNFAVTFDDVPADASNGIGILEELRAPFAVSVCGQLAHDGWGIRDKVYSIVKYLDAHEIEDFVRAQLPEAATSGESVSFYHLTKRPDLDPELLRDRLIEPLFATVEDRARPYLSGAYLSWSDIRGLFSGNPLATLANHSWRHDNLAAYGRRRLAAEIRESHDIFARETGCQPRYFTVPFGRFTQRLAQDLITPLQRLGYRGVLWVGESGNAVRGACHAQVTQLIRLHAPTTVDDFSRAVTRAAQNPVDAAIRQVADRPHRKPVRIISSSAARPVLNYEMLMRQGKDYSSDPLFYQYQFTDNPYKGDRPDYYAVLCDEAIEATAYNFHASFSVGGQPVPGVYLASWRRLPEAHIAASGLLVRRMTDRECVVGVYRPSSVAARALQDWRRVTVYRHVIPVPGDPAAPRAPAGQYRVMSSARYDRSLVTLAQDTARRAGFTISRDASYYTWRFGSYPLAPCRYFTLLSGDTPAGYCVVLWTRSVMSIADFSVLAPAELAALVREVLAFAHFAQVLSVTLETSSRELSDCLERVFGAEAEEFRNYYHFNDRLLAAQGITSDIDCLWHESAFHETAATGDVLLR